MNKITVILAEDHKVVRQGLCALINQQRDMVVVGEADNGLQLLGLVEKFHPNVVVVDIKMSSQNGLITAEQIHKRFPATHAVILSMYGDRAYLDHAVQVGVYGYVLKDEGHQELFNAIHAAAEGRRYFSAKTMELNPDFLGKPATRPFPLTTLTERELQVLQLAAEGKKNREIAVLLGISVRTVETYRANLMTKLNLTSSAALISFAIKYGIVNE
jgi:DNA-binding NarL/FixJ family response regulator